ncbi:MAG: hypothetical protein M0Q94_05740 [Candidatus Cloacimonetes bacterium]|nr:hypothetical protein [Candidatus Cloacimonadota bacterium]
MGNLLISFCFSQKEADLANVVILGRLISPGNELHTYKLNQKNYRKSWKEIREVLRTHIRTNIIQNDKKDNSYSIRVTGTPKTKAYEIYDLLEIKISPNRVIRRLRNLDCST